MSVFGNRLDHLLGFLLGLRKILLIRLPPCLEPLLFLLLSPEVLARLLLFILLSLYSRGGPVKDAPRLLVGERAEPVSAGG